MATAERVAVTATTTINSIKVNPDEALLFQRNLGKETGLLRQVGMLFLSKRHIEIFGAPRTTLQGYRTAISQSKMTVSGKSRLCFAFLRAHQRGHLRTPLFGVWGIVSNPNFDGLFPMNYVSL